MYIATGDGNGSDTNSTGVLKSTDGGQTWQTTGLNWTVSQGRRIRRVIMDPDNSEMLLAATSIGLYRTTNGGNSWNELLTGNFHDVRANPLASSNTFYASTTNTIYRSTNNGANWSTLQTISGANRIVLGVSPANNNYVYALCSSNADSGFLGLYRSTNSGSSFTLRSSSPNLLGYNQTGTDTGGQGWYDLCIAIDPTNAEIVYTGGVNTWKSTNGGQTWNIITMWYSCSGCPQAVHADKHCMEFQNNNTLWQGNDGGIYITTNGGNSWQDKINGLVISQLYRLDLSQTDSRIITGLQDNGTKIRTTTLGWIDRIGGDGMDCAIRPDNSNVMYGSYQNGNFFRSTNGGTNFSSLNVPDGDTGAWVTPITIDPNATQTIYTAFKRIHKSTNQGTSWTTISGNLNNSNLTFLHVAPSNSNYIYTGRSNAMYRTINGGSNWSTMTVPGSGTIELAIHPNNPNTIWAVRSNYNAGQKVYKSTNGGSTWTNVSGSLPNLPANCIIYQNGTDDGLYVGMDVGVYYRDNTMEDWELFNEGLPNVQIRDLKIKYDTEEIYAGTYGRGTWKSELRNPENACPGIISINIDSILNNTAYISWSIPNPAVHNGYLYAATTTSSPPSNGEFTNNTSAIISGLNSNTYYYFHVRGLCGETEISSWRTIGPIITRASCGDQSSDTGGPSDNYSDNENTIRYICPDGPYQQVVLTFTDFQVESQWDALYIYNGNSINAPLFSSGNPPTQGGFPAGGYYGTSLPGPFTSTHPSGCLTLQFRSDETITQRGWLADVSCFNNCASVVRTTDNDGFASLRNVIACAPNGSTINFGPQVNNDTIRIISPISITKDINLIVSNQNIIVEAMHDGHIFHIMPGKTVQIENIHFIGGKGNNNTRVFLNEGHLSLNSVDIIDTKADQGTGRSIENSGILNVSDNCIIRKN